MQKTTRLLALVFLLSGFVLSMDAAFAADTAQDLDLRLIDARDTFREFTAIPEDSIPRDFIEKARAILIFPGTIKGGFLFAMKFGRGVVMVRDSDGSWSPPAFVRISGGSFGLQLGADWTDLILLAKTESAVQAIFDNRFTLSGNLAATFGPWGRHTEIGTDWQLKSAVFAYSRSKGLFAAVSTDGSVISFDQPANELYYGPNIGLRDIVYDRKVTVGTEAKELMSTVQGYEPPPIVKKVIDVFKKSADAARKK